MAEQQFKLSYLDFLPNCLKQGGFVSLPEFERFDVLIARANDWLAANPGMKISSCESLELPWNSYSPEKGDIPMLSNEESLFYEAGNRPVCYVRTLRLWIASKHGGDDPSPVRLGYYNVIPVCLKQGGFFKMPEFERFDETITKINQMFQSQPLQGRIINIETQDMKFETWTQGGVDPDANFWFESGKAPTCFLNILRIFYQGGPPAMEQIGCVDIVPQVQGSGMNITGEPFGVIAQRANQWIVEHPGIRVTNLQSINYKMDLSAWRAKVQGVDTMRTLFYKSGKITTVFCRIIRIGYTTSMSGAPMDPPPQMTFRSFMPAMVRPSGSSMIYNPKFETMSQNMGRLVAWLNHTGAKVIGAETIRMIIRHNSLDPEATVTYDSGARVDVWLYMYRLYVDGHYTDPPPGALPPPPPMEEPQSVSCCTIL